MEWSNEVTLSFLDLLEKETVIWDPKNLKHKNRSDVADAWTRIQEALSIDVKELKKKKESLWATFRPLYKRVISSQKSGASADDVYTPTWFAYKKIEGFVKSIYEHRRATNTQEFDSILVDDSECGSGTIFKRNPDVMSRIFSSGTDLERNQEVSNRTSSSETNLEKNLEFSSRNSSSGTNLERNPEVSNRTSSSGTNLQRNPDIAIGASSSGTNLGRNPEVLSRSSSSRKRKRNDLEGIGKCISEAFRYIQKMPTKPKKDACSQYGELLATNLRSFDERTRAIVMNEIDNIIFKAKMAIIEPFPTTSTNPGGFSSPRIQSHFPDVSNSTIPLFFTGSASRYSFPTAPTFFPRNPCQNVEVTGENSGSSSPTPKSQVDDTN